MFTPQKMILTAGPKRSHNEVRYVTDAVKHGWNFHHSDYIHKFEEEFAKYLGVSYALTMPSGTSALHMSLALMGIGPGDEVIVPDFTYVACASAVSYTGAKPVFAEVDWDTWTLDPTKLERYITSRTKAIMPVHLYGNVADMDGIKKVAKKHNLYIVEDACQGLGCTIHGKKLGTLSDAAGFSFQGAKLLAIGEGGMFVTNRKDWINRARSLAYQGVSKKQFWHKEKGFTYFMSNIQAALGLARLEEIDDLIERKRRIFHWYKERLDSIEGIIMNPERKGVRSSFWMSSIVLTTKHRLTRNQLRKALRANKIDTRPFFYPISAFKIHTKGPLLHPVSYRLASSGINLPSGVCLTEREVDYISRTIRSVLGR